MTAVGVSFIALASVGPALGVTVTTCAAPPLVTTMDAVTVHVPKGNVAVHVIAMHATASLTVVLMPTVTTSLFE